MKFTPRQYADLRDRFLSGGDNTVPGSYIIDGSLVETKIDPVSVAKWQRAYDLRVETWNPPLTWVANVASVLAQGVDTDIDVVVTVSGTTYTRTLCVRNGLITDYAGAFDVVDPASGITITLNAVDGYVVPSASFLAVDTDSGVTRLYVVLAGRITGI